MPFIMSFLLFVAQVGLHWVSSFFKKRNFFSRYNVILPWWYAFVCIYVYVCMCVYIHEFVYWPEWSFSEAWFSVYIAPSYLLSLYLLGLLHFCNRLGFQVYIELTLTLCFISWKHVFTACWRIHFESTFQDCPKQILWSLGNFSSVIPWISIYTLPPSCLYRLL